MGSLKIIRVNQRMLASNERTASALRRRFAKAGVRVLNLLGSPGSGKTALLEATLRAAGKTASIAVIEGDVATCYDAKRIAATGTQVVQIETQGACHLNAAMVREAVKSLDLAKACGCDLGQLHANVLRVNPTLRVFETSAKTGLGIAPWLRFVEDS